MEKEIKEFKRLNGNYIKYTPKELIGALHVKVDKINDRLSDGDKLLSSHTTWIKAFRWLIGGICIVMGYLVLG